MMKKKMSKPIVAALLLSLLLAVTAVFTGCSSAPANLEEYINSNEEAMETLDALSSSGLAVEVKENTITYTYQYDQTFDASVLDAMASEIESTLEASSSTFTSLAESLEEEAGIEDITVKVVYLNGDGSEIFSKEY